MIDYGYGVALGTITDAEELGLMETRNLPSIMRWCRQSDLINANGQKKWIERVTSDPSVRMYTIDNDVIVGVCGLTDVTPVHNTAEFSIYVDPDQQRCGYGEAALKTLVRHGFENLNLNRIWGETFEGNPATVLYERLGFKKEGDLRQTYWKEGRFINSSIWSLLKSEYVRY